MFHVGLLDAKILIKNKLPKMLAVFLSNSTSSTLDNVHKFVRNGMISAKKEENEARFAEIWQNCIKFRE